MKKRYSTICEWINKQDGPWHVWFDLPYPHLPCRPSEPFASMYKPEDTVPWESFGNTLENKPYIQQQQIHNWHLEDLKCEDFAPCVARYYGMMTQIDDAVGRIIRTLENKGILDDTLIVFTSDHGDTSGGHGMMDKHYIFYDDVTRVPLIIRYPAAFEKGGVCSEFVSNCLDFATTVEALANIPPAGVRHGISFMDSVAGKNPEKFSVSTSNGQQFGLFTQRCMYTYRWSIEEVFNYYKNVLDIDNVKVQHDTRLYGSEFINYIASVITCRIRNYIDACGLSNKYSFRQIMTYLSVLHGKVWDDGREINLTREKKKSSSR